MLAFDQCALISFKSPQLFHMAPHLVIKHRVWTVHRYIPDIQISIQAYENKGVALTYGW